MDINAVIDKLYVKHKAEREELLYIVNNINEGEKGYLIKKARTLAEQNFSNKVFLRGLIEFYKLLQERLLLLWYKKKQLKCCEVQAYAKTDT